MHNYILAAAVFLIASVIQPAKAATLVGWAEMPMHTHVEGPTAGQFNFGGEVISNKQAVQGFSAVLASEADNHFYFLTDNGFGEKKNSADVLLRLYEIEVDFSNANRKSNAVYPLRFVNIKDPDRKLSFKIQADFSHYYNKSSNPLVDQNIIENRWLTGADIDPESVRSDKNGSLWLGDEFGPFLVKVDAKGRVLRQEISLPEVSSLDHPNSIKLRPNLPISGGFEGMAVNTAGDMLYPMLESSLQGDAEKILRIYQFDVNAERYTDKVYYYELDAQATSIGDFVAVNDHEFLVVERNAGTDIKDKPLKKIYQIDINQINSEKLVQKRELLDLMQLKDPNDLNKDGEFAYAFAYSHIENLLIIDKNTLLVANDNNYKGRTYFIKIKLDNDLNVASFKQININKNDWVTNKVQPHGFNFGDHSFFGWMTVVLYFIAATMTGYKAKVTFRNKESCYFWLGLMLFLILLGLNKQLDLQTNITQWLRSLAKAQGWYEQRRGYQLLFISIMGLAIPILLISLRMFLYHSWQRYKLTWVGIVLLLVFILVRAASFHHVDNIFYQTIGNLRYYQATEMFAILLIVIGSIYHKRLNVVSAMPAQNVQDIIELTQEGDDVHCPKCGTKAMAAGLNGRLFKCKACAHKYIVQVLSS